VRERRAKKRRPPLDERRSTRQYGEHGDARRNPRHPQTYEFGDCMEDDGVTNEPIWMRLKLVIKNDEGLVDWIWL